MMDTMDLWDEARKRLAVDDGTPLYERIAGVIEGAIEDGRLGVDERLPTVRELAQVLQVSSSTAVSTYNLLRKRDRIRGEVGRGTFVGRISGRDQATRAPDPAPFVLNQASAWRKRSLLNAENRLRARHHGALDLTWGRPDHAFFPVDAIRRAYSSVVGELDATQLQYPQRAEPEPELLDALESVLADSAITGIRNRTVMCTSTQQAISLIVDVLRLGPSGASRVPTVAVENPGYQTAMDTFERAGFHLIGFDIDEHGPQLPSLESALSKGVDLVFLTARAHSPTGASWSAERREELVRLLRAHRDPIILEDDPLGGVAATPLRSLIEDPELADRVIHVRSFSKVLGPDLRVAAVVAQGRLFDAFTQAKAFADSWTSRFNQRVLARVLTDDQTQEQWAAARAAYRTRRTLASVVIDEALGPVGGRAFPGADGLHVWVELPPGRHGADVMDAAAALGALVAPGEPFHVTHGRTERLRMNVGALSESDAERAATYVAEAALTGRAAIADIITM